MTLARRLGCALIAALVGLAEPVFGEGIAPDERRSTYAIMAPETRKLQDDETRNPGMLWALDGEALWDQPAGQSGKACATCHGAAVQSMRGVAARYPRFDAAAGRVLNVEQRINLCRVRQQSAPQLAMESRELLALSAFVGLQSRGMPIDVDAAGGAEAAYASGRRLFFQRFGQLDLSCAHCHDERWHRKLGGVRIPQAHPTGYPIYRLEWQAMGSLARRLRNCLTGVRAEPFALESQEYVDLELYLKVRAKGLAIETPAVRP
jgi:sulfur-oxidizing protein SoxA